jgi:AraC-like DNA-binding protein/quercetin dioxygenase-like cupin family protein
VPKALYEKIPLDPGRSTACRAFCVPTFTAPWHFHPECELTLIVKGRGTRYVGDSIGRFSDGDLVFLGSNLPHYWWKDADDRCEARAVVLQFDEHLGGGLFDMPEAARIRRLLKAARRGIVLGGSIRDKVTTRLAALPDREPWMGLCGLLEILGLMAAARPWRFLASAAYAPDLDESDGLRLAAVSRYVQESFAGPISQPRAAALAGLSPAAFSRYFHKRMCRTFEAYVNEVRVSHASRMLRESEHTVAEIAFACGFNNLSNFNRRFRQFRGTSPTLYRRQALGNTGA